MIVILTVWQIQYLITGLLQPFLGLGPGPLQLGNTAAFYSKFGKLTVKILLSGNDRL